VSATSDRDKLKDRAIRLVSQAIKAGTILRPTSYNCADCGKPACQYDHRDYREPLNVAPVCRSCNIRRGPGLPKIQDHDELSNKRPRSFDGFVLIHGTDVGGGEGFDPTFAVCHADLDRLISDEKAREYFKYIQSASSKKQNLDRLRMNRFNYRAEDGKNRFSMPTGISRANWFKERDPWRLT